MGFTLDKFNQAIKEKRPQFSGFQANQTNLTLSGSVPAGPITLTTEEVLEGLNKPEDLVMLTLRKIDRLESEHNKLTDITS